LEAGLALAALAMALSERKPQPGWVHHSDRGVQYASQDYTDLLKQHQARISMSRKGNPVSHAAVLTALEPLGLTKDLQHSMVAGNCKKNDNQPANRESQESNTVTFPILLVPCCMQEEKGRQPSLASGGKRQLGRASEKKEIVCVTGESPPRENPPWWADSAPAN